jgi:D-tyrosyl-tRNA(Tyr) deacylase
VVLQRVSRAAVTVEDRTVGEIGPGVLLLVGVGQDEREHQIQRLAEKIYHLRIFEDGSGKMNLALLDAGGSILLIPQFTLYADWRRGRRPSWARAAPPEIAARHVEALGRALESLGATVARGAFGEHMEVDLVNDGPVTLVLDSADL